MAKAGDRVVRAMTDDGGFRVITTRTTDTVRAAVEAQHASGEVALRFGELLTGAVLYRETMAPQLRVQAILNGLGGHGQLVADSNPEGDARGLVRLPKGGEKLVLSGGLLQMMRTMPQGDLHRGVVEVPTDGRISSALMSYLMASEQVLSMVSVGARTGKDGMISDAGGYIIQLLPELEEPMLMLMTERLEDFRTVEDLFDGVAASPEELLSELLYGIPYTILDESNVRFDCSCSQVRVLASLGTLGRADIEDLMRDGTDLEMTCDYCGKEYHVSPEQLRGMLDPT
jgi:molecular chaperone Hsp33